MADTDRELLELAAKAAGLFEHKWTGIVGGQSLGLGHFISPLGGERMLTNNQLEVMRHALGIQRGRGEFRNHFVTGPGSVDFADCEVLVSLGMMIKRSGNQLTGGDPCYHVTDSGRHAIRLARKGEA